MRVLLALSLLANAAAAGAGLLLARRRGGLPWLLVRAGLRAAPPPDYAALGAQRFGGPDEPGGVIWWGDSICQNAPLLRMLADARQWGIGGQTIADVRSWLPQVVEARPDRLVISAGTNDLLLGRPSAAVAADLAALLDAASAALPACEVLALAVPPLTGREASAAAVNAALAGRMLDPWRDAGDGWTLDGVHPTPGAYLRVRPTGTGTP